MNVKEHAGGITDVRSRNYSPADNYIGGLESLICRTIQNRPTNEDAIRGIR